MRFNPDEPVFYSRIEGYVVNFLTKHYWKVEATMTRDDAKQEAYIVFLRVKRKYVTHVPKGAKRVTEPAHFMALFKTAWSNAFINFANEDTAQRALLAPMPTMRTEDGIREIEQQGETTNDGELAVMLRQAPSEVRAVLSMMLGAPQEILDIALQAWRGRGTDKMGSRPICKLLGLDPSIDVMQMTEDYFTKR